MISWIIYLILLPWLTVKFRLWNKVKKDSNKNLILLIRSETFLEFLEDYFCDQ